MTDTSELLSVCNDLNIVMHADFIPWSASRNAGEKMPSLNWKVTLSKGERAILTTDYMQGCGHCKAYKQGRMTADEMADLKRECQDGHWRGKRHTIGLADVLPCLLSEADALDYPDYETWAADLGYDPDSRRGEAVYRQCLDTGLRLRAAWGEDGLRRLREAARDL